MADGDEEITYSAPSFSTTDDKKEYRIKTRQTWREKARAKIKGFVAEKLNEQRELSSIRKKAKWEERKRQARRAGKEQVKNPFGGFGGSYMERELRGGGKRPRADELGSGSRASLLGESRGGRRRRDNWF